MAPGTKRLGYHTACTHLDNRVDGSFWITQEHSSMTTKRISYLRTALERLYFAIPIIANATVSFVCRESTPWPSAVHVTRAADENNRAIDFTSVRSSTRPSVKQSSHPCFYGSDACGRAISTTGTGLSRRAYPFNGCISFLKLSCEGLQLRRAYQRSPQLQIYPYQECRGAGFVW